jgi:hypothetical protein
MNFRSLKLYKVFKEDGKGCVTFSINNERMIPLLEIVYGLGKSKYTRIGPIKVVRDGLRGFKYNYIYHKRA